jgi:iron complex outermembrane receptor protein
MSQTNLNRGEEALVPDGVTNDFGAMSIFNYVREKLSMQVGLRMDERAISTEMMIHEDGDSIDAFAGTFQSVNFAVGSVYREGNSSFRVNISSGFRAPTTSELLSFGTHEGTNRFEIGNSSLRSEMAKQVDLSYSYRSEHLSFEVNTFYNSIDNYIYLEPWDSVMDDVPVYAYTQSAASLYGGEAGVHFHPHNVHWLHLESNFSTVIAEDKYGNALPLIPANTLATKARVELKKKGKWGFTEIYMQHIYTFRQDRPALFETATADYTLINTGFAMEFGEGENPIQFSAGVRNLFNQRYIDHLSRLKPMGFANPGMNVYVTLKIPFEKVLPEDEH